MTRITWRFRRPSDMCRESVLQKAGPRSSTHTSTSMTIFCVLTQDISKALMEVIRNTTNSTAIWEWLLILMHLPSSGSLWLNIKLGSRIPALARAQWECNQDPNTFKKPLWVLFQMAVYNGPPRWTSSHKQAHSCMWLWSFVFFFVTGELMPSNTHESVRLWHQGRTSGTEWPSLAAALSYRWWLVVCPRPLTKRM